MLTDARELNIRKEPILNGFFFLFLVIIITNRIALFFTINQDYIDNDQVVMWLGAKHYSMGIFYEPRFYGQDYNTMMESLFAVPFIKMGFPIYYAVPIATHIIFLTPFLFTAAYLFIKQKKQEAIIVLGVLLLMPTGYDIMNSIPRGFVTGLFFTSGFIVSLLNTKNYSAILVNTFLAYLGHLTNPNSILVSAPFLFYLFLVNYRDKKYYLYSTVGLLFAAPIDYGLNHFYKDHPEYVLYGFSQGFSFQYFREAILNLNKRFAHISFITEENSILTLSVLLMLGVITYKQNKKLFLSYLVFIGILVISFFSSKTSDGIVWPFYSYSRMYLGVPVFVYLLISATGFNLKKVVYVFVFGVLIFSTYKEWNFKKSVAYHVQENRWQMVNLTSLKDIIETLNIYKNFCRKEQVDFLLIDPVWRDDLINYAGPALYDDFPQTLKPSFERRGWRIKEEKNKIHNKFAFYTANYDFDRLAKEKYPNINVTRLDDWGLFLIKDNKLTTLDFLKTINAPTQGF